MRALVAESSAPGRIALHDVLEPVAEPGEVLVDVRAFSINRGEMRISERLPMAGVPMGLRRDPPVRRRTRARAGARVVDIRRGGSWAEQVAVHEGWIAELPDRSFCSRGDLPTAGLAALRMLRMGPSILVAESW